MANAPKRTGGRILADQLALHGARLDFRRSGRELPAGAGRALRHARDQRFIAAVRRAGRRTWPRPMASSPGGRASASSPAAPAPPTPASGVHTAVQDSTPDDPVHRPGRSDGSCDRECFQEVDFRAMFAPLAKWVAEIDDAARIPEYVSRAFQPRCRDAPAPWCWRCRRTCWASRPTPPTRNAYQRIEAHPSPRRSGARSGNAGGGERPSWWSAAAAGRTRPRGAQAFAEASGLPVAASFRRQDSHRQRQPNYVGDVGLGINPRLAERVKNADCCSSLGARLGEMATSGYTLLESPRPAAAAGPCPPGPE